MSLVLEQVSGTVLLAEDGLDNQRLIQMYLDNAGATATVVENGRQAVEAALRESYDLILMDIQMPVMSGLDALIELRKSGYTGPVVALTANVMAGDVSRYRGAGFDGCLAKPIERAAFERSGTRLYEALITKFQGVQALGQEVLVPADQLPAFDGAAAAPGSVMGEAPLQTLMRIRNEELEHFRMLGMAIEKMGGDPTAQTPCADVTATASMGILQVVTDPRTTLAQCLNAVLTAELTDNAGWELLIQLAEDAGETELAGRFLGALSQEQEHLAIVKGWLTQLVTQGAGTPAV